MTTIPYIGKPKHDPDQLGRNQAEFLRWFFGEQGFKWLEDKVKEKNQLSGNTGELKE